MSSPKHLFWSQYVKRIKCTCLVSKMFSLNKYVTWEEKIKISVSGNPDNRNSLTHCHYGQVTHICVSNLAITGSDNGLSRRCQAITWTNAGILSIGPLGTNFSEILIEINTFSFKKMRLKVSSVKWWPFCLSLNVLTHCGQVTHICISKLGHHWFRKWPAACLTQSHYQDQCWLIVN